MGLKVDNCNFDDGKGGGIRYAHGSDVEVTNSTFRGLVGVAITECDPPPQLPLSPDLLKALQDYVAAKPPTEAEALQHLNEPASRGVFGMVPVAKVAKWAFAHPELVLNVVHELSKRFT